MNKEILISLGSVLAICCHLALRFFSPDLGPLSQIPLYLCLLLGGVPLVLDLLRKLIRADFGSDLLAGVSIVTAVFLGEYLAGSFVVLMLSGGAALERFAVRSASSALKALSDRVPRVARRRTANGVSDIAVSEIQVGDEIVILPHGVCPVDGIVIEGHGRMNEAYLTGEPFELSKAPGSAVISGAINGDTLLITKATRTPEHSRYAKILRVMQEAEKNRPALRRMADKLGAYYTPVAVILALAAWLVSGDPVRFLAVLVVATPCPLLIAIPIAIIGSVSLAAKRGIVVRDPSALEAVTSCKTMILDKTGTLTYGEPVLAKEFVDPKQDKEELLQIVASLEQYSKHPLATAVLKAAEGRGLTLSQAAEVSEPPGQGMAGVVSGKRILVTSRKHLARLNSSAELPAAQSGLECVIVIDGNYAATYVFHDGPRYESRPFIEHLRERHGINRLLLVSGDRESEVRYLAELVGISMVSASTSPEEKVRIVREESKKANTIFIGDGINDAPALAAATVGIAFGPNSDVTAEAAGAVILDATLTRVDEFLHIGARMYRIALQSAVGGMALSIAGMCVAAAGLLSPVWGAVTQEVIDVLAILNALRVALPPASLVDFKAGGARP